MIFLNLDVSEICFNDIWIMIEKKHTNSMILCNLGGF